MKESVKYLISTIIFLVLYVLIQLICMSQIDWKITIVATILYGVTNTLYHIAFIKKIK